MRPLLDGQEADRRRTTPGAVDHMTKCEKCGRDGAKGEHTFEDGGAMVKVQAYVRDREQWAKWADLCMMCLFDHMKKAMGGSIP